MAIEVPAVAGKIINLGRAGENLATTVVFDVSSWIEEFGTDGTFNLFIQQGTDDYYPQVVTGPTNGKVQWDVVNSNTAIVGLGKCELSYNKVSDDIEKPRKEGYYYNSEFYEDSTHTIKIEPNGLYLYVDLGHSNNLYYYDGMNYISTTTGAENTKQTIVVKSMIYDIMVTNALDVGQGGEMPTAIQSWIDAANAELAQVQNVKQWVVGDNPDPDPGSPSDINNAMYYMKQAQEAANSVIGLGVSGTTTGQAGSNASVTINTQSNPYTLAFTIPKGSQWFTGTVVNGTSASVSGAKINDYYLNTNTSQVWICTGANDSAGTTWASVCNLKGSQGDRGSKWFTGNGNPGSVSGATTDDFYLNKSNGAVWKCANSTGSSWTSVLNITGPTGPYFTPSVDTSGTISWTNNGGLTNPDSRSIKGPQGDPAPEITSIAINQSNYHLIITLSDGSSYDAGYCRGAAGSGSGDMTMAVYDTHGKQQDIYDYADAKYSKPSGGIPKTDLASAVQTSLGKADTALQSFTETDPTVPSWAKASTKPSYTASEVGALPDSTVIPQGTVTSVRVQASSPLQSSTNTAQTTSLNTTLSFSNQNANKILAGPSSGSSAAAPTFRALVEADIPTITTSKISNFPSIPSTAADVGAIANPSTKQEGNVLTYNGTNWVASEPATGLPDMTNKSGRYLYTDGQDADWMEIDALPNQSSLTNGQVLTSVYNSSTSASSAEWQVLSGVTGQLSTPAIRNIYAGTADLTSSNTLPEGTIYLVYEA